MMLHDGTLLAARPLHLELVCLSRLAIDRRRNNSATSGEPPEESSSGERGCRQDGERAPTEPASRLGPSVAA